MRLVFLILLAVHALIHLTGFASAFFPGAFAGLQQNISRTNGVLWLTASILLIAGAVTFMMKVEQWWMLALAGLIISQYVIINSWTDAKYGTALNILILLAVFAGYGSWHFHKRYRDDVKAFINKKVTANDILTEEDIAELPELVKKYIRYTRAIGKPKVKSFRVVFKGRIRDDEKSEWMPFISEQYNFVDNSARLFFMDAVMRGLPVAGYHRFLNGDAFMDIRLLSLFRVQYQSGREMGIAETVTFLNDMCCMAPATLIDKRIRWAETAGNKAEAVFTNNGTTVTAWLYFNEAGQLVNFISGDRYAILTAGEMEKLRWKTPIKNYRNYNGHLLPGYADAVYEYPAGDFCYGNFSTEQIDYNPE